METRHGRPGEHLLEELEVAVTEAHGPDRTFTHVSAPTERLTGHVADRWLQEQGFWLNHVHADDRAATSAAYHRALQAGGSHVLEYRFQRAAGGTMWLREELRVRGERVVSMLCDVTAQRAELEELQESRERYLGLVESAFDGVVVAQRGRVVACNPAMERIYRAPREQLVGRAVGELVAPESLPEVNRRFQDNLEGRYEVVGIRSDGSRVMLELCSRSCRFDGMPARLVAMRDIGEQKRVQEELQRQTALYEAILRAQSDLGLGVCVVGLASQRILLANEALSQINGYTQEEMRAWPTYLQVVAPEDVPEALERRRRREAGGPVSEHHETRIIHKRGHRVPVEASIKGVTLEGQRCMLVVIRDITDRQRRQEALISAQKLDSLGVLAGGIAHDFNNLLSVILGHAALAATGLQPDNPALEWLEGIESASVRAAELCQQLLSYAGKNRMEMRRVDVGTLVEDAAKVVRPSLSGNATLHHVNGVTLPPVQADPAQVRQAILSLVINAVEALAQQPGEVTVRTGVMDVDHGYLAQCQPPITTAAGRCVYVEVQDTGSGMDAATRARIFEPFFSTKFAGRGLGLAAVLGIVRAHRGALRVESAPGAGSVFRLLLPVAEGVSEPARRPTPPPFTAQGTILVVDDEEGVRALVASVLQRSGLTVLQARHGAEALELYARERGRISAAVVDLTMPGMGGLEVLRGLLELDPKARVILMSGYTEDHITDEVGRRGHAAFLRKPFRPEELREALRRVLDRLPAGAVN
ncbi:MAG: PAS domain S-box protein [Myxococcota bacterium]